MRIIAVLAVGSSSAASTITFAIAVFVFAACPAAFAQMCAGGPSLSDSPIQLGGGLAASVKSHAVHFSATVGGPKVFATATFEQRERTDTDRKADEIRLRVGWDLNGPMSDRLQLCPIAEFSHRNLSGRDWGPDGQSITGVASGLFLSKTIASAGVVRVVPTVALVAGIASDGVESAPDGYGRFGVSFIVNRWLSLHPTFTIPAASDIPDFAVALSAIVGIGKP